MQYLAYIAALALGYALGRYHENRKVKKAMQNELANRRQQQH